MSGDTTIAWDKLVAFALGGAFVGAMGMFNYMKGQTSTENAEEKLREIPLGPAQTNETLFKLNLVGRVDRLYDDDGNIQLAPKPFEFNHQVVQVFDDMVSRSVPLYTEVIDLLLYWANKYYIKDTVICDLGCSTGTTLDVIARSMGTSERVRLVGVDNSEAMVEACKKKLSIHEAHHEISIHFDDILKFPIENASMVIMNYTLQFVRVEKRHELLSNIFQGLAQNGILFLSEKIRTEYSEFQETATWIYEDFKYRRGYSKTAIARKKDALMNVLIPFTEAELRSALHAVGFEHIEVIAKWNNFTTFVAKKTGLKKTIGKSHKQTEVVTPHLDRLFDACPVYLSDYLNPLQLQEACLARLTTFADKGKLGAPTLQQYDEIAQKIQEIPQMTSKRLIVNESVLAIGDPEELTEEQKTHWLEVCNALKPWKKGPLNLFGVEIDTEWRSDWKWERIKPHLPSLKDKVVCDLGCGNGYFMYRMLEHEPKLVMGLDPNIHAWIEFKIFQRFSGVSNVQLEVLRGEHMELFPDMFDVVFCLGVLYHTSDPIGMLRTIHKSMKKGSTLIVDCQGIPGDEPIALFPKKRYANMTGVYFLPTIKVLKFWLNRANFINHEIIFSEKLSTEEQRITEWAPVNTSLRESLDETETKTIEGYPAPHRFYIRAKRG